MKRWICVVIAILVFGGLIYWYESSKEDFQIYNSITTGMDNYDSATLQVVINKCVYDDEAMIKKVYEFYCQGGEPDKLTINLYDSVKDLENGNCRLTRVYENE